MLKPLGALGMLPRVMLLVVRCVMVRPAADGAVDVTLVTVNVGAGLSVALAPWLVFTVTVAFHVPTARPFSGRMVKSLKPPTGIAAFHTVPVVVANV
jgi:hypothetical protein